MALTEKWNLARAAERSRDELDRLVKERTRELELANGRLEAQMNERVELERRLQHAQKLEALGRLVAGVAHEVNNPLSYVLASLGHLEEELSRLEAGEAEAARELHEAVAEAKAGGKRIQQIVQDLTTFSRPDKSGVETIVLEDVIRFALRMAGPSFPPETRIEEQFREVPVVRANPGLLSQVFVNLLANAGRALAGVAADRRVLRVGLEAGGAGTVLVTVRDQGVGIPEPLLGSIFDPFFTTQPQGEGTGLGLYICQGIVQRMGGEIRIESREGVGTLARVALPLAPPPRLVERPPSVGVLAEPPRA
jgi:signal transduction histidine kinase